MDTLPITGSSVLPHMKSQVEEAGGAFEASNDGFEINFTGLDHVRLTARRHVALRTIASLMFRFDDAARVSAVLPESPRTRRALASSGLMFALVHQHANLRYESREDAAEPGLVPASQFARLTSSSSWRRSFSPHDSEIRDLLLGTGRESAVREAESYRRFRGLGVIDREFTAFVNPHELPPGTELRSISNVATPWLTSFLAAESVEYGDAKVAHAVELLGHALDNVREHAFEPGMDAASLVTMGKVRSGDRDWCELQVLDNGIGIAASLARQLGEIVSGPAHAEQLLSRAVLGDDEAGSLLAYGRGMGLPRMRVLARLMGGILTITSSAPEGAQISIRCQGDKPSLPMRDLVPVVGTIISLALPLDGGSQVRNDDDTHVPEQEMFSL